MSTARDIIQKLNMQPHPEGGWFVETFRSNIQMDQQEASTAIYYLLEEGQSSHWHKVLHSDEIWNWYAGSPLKLKISYDAQTIEEVILGNDLLKAQVPQAIVPQDVWQAAEPVENWCLVGCIVAPAFNFDNFVMAPKDWTPGQALPSSE